MFKKEFYEKIYNRFLKLHGEPHEIAAGFALGIFISFSPLLGFHAILAIGLTAILKWNKISSTIGIFITNPITAPFIYGFTYIIGKKIFHIFIGNNLPAEIQIKNLYTIIYSAPNIFICLFIGGAIVGIPIAILGYFLALTEIKTYREKIKDKHIPQKIAQKLHLTKKLPLE